jgi:hypothetical protein
VSPGTTQPVLELEGPDVKRSSTCKLWIVGGVVAGAAALSLSGAAFGSGASGIEHLTFMSTNVTADKFNVIATGAFTAGGTATPLAAKDTLKFPNGTITATATSKGRPALTADTKTCLETLSQRGTYKIAGGTGAYSGMTGSGTFTLRIRAIGPIVNGKCELKTSRRVASQAIVTANGRITHK